MRITRIALPWGNVRISPGRMRRLAFLTRSPFIRTRPLLTIAVANARVLKKRVRQSQASNRCAPSSALAKGERFQSGEGAVLLDRW